PLVAQAEAAGVRLVAFGPQTVRAVMHLDVSEPDVEEAGRRLRSLFAA
ncbi:MAG: low specificity L-threonine aldolase, partial [Candidatus Dormibacteraeota bacterium]|nr:low specificity L-threonine aldolase [Candidatus Dormibacteraeota bacterium]